MSQGILTINERKMREKRITCSLPKIEREKNSEKQNLHTTPSFYSHLSAIFMFCWADFSSSLPSNNPNDCVSFPLRVGRDALKKRKTFNDSNQKIANFSSLFRVPSGIKSLHTWMENSVNNFTAFMCDLMLSRGFFSRFDFFTRFTAGSNFNN